jgi:hypothetical protein
MALPAYSYVVKDLFELFHTTVPSGSSVRVRATAPVQAMGIAVDASGDATPVPPR